MKRRRSWITPVILILTVSVLTATPHVRAETVNQVITTGDIIRAISLTCPAAGLAFGEITPGSEPGTVTVTFTGGRTLTGDVSLGSVGASPAECTTTGADRHVYTIALPEDPITLNNLAGPGTMTVTGLNTPDLRRLLGESGTDTFVIVGTLNVGGNQTPGTYSGTFIVTVAYA